MHRKRALVIGNRNYPKLPLKNSDKDAKSIREVLRSCGYEVMLVIDCTRQSFLDTVDLFLRETDPNDLVLLFYSGHGIQYKGTNYIIPIDAENKLGEERQVKSYCIDVEETLTHFSEKVCYVTIFILDCCRTNIVDRRSRGYQAPTIGLHSMAAPGGTLIQYACSPGTVADDGDDESNNGLFTKHLIKQLKIPNKRLDELLNVITRDVYIESNKQQLPSHVSSLMIDGPIYLNEKSIPALHNVVESMKWSCASTISLKNLSSRPFSLTLNQRDGTIFVADTDNNRIVCYDPNRKEQRVILSHLNRPTCVVFDSKSHSVLIADSDNRRILRVSLRNENVEAENVLDQIDCHGLAIDDDNYLYVTDTKKHEVRRYSMLTKKYTIAAGGNGQGSSTCQLNWPNSVAIGKHGEIYVSDLNNHRVMKWILGEKNGTIVAGFDRQGAKRTQLSFPQCVIVDEKDHLFIADRDNNRIVCSRGDDKCSDVIIDSSQIRCPYALSFDRQKNLYVVDSSRRVTCFTRTE